MNDRYGEPVERDAQIIAFRPRPPLQAIQVADRDFARRHLAEARAVLSIVKPTPTPVVTIVQPSLELNLSTIVDARKDHHATGT
jgi:hypothetical protein